MNQQQNRLDSMDSFRVRQVDLNTAPQEVTEVPLVDQVPTTALPDNSAADAAKTPEEQKIDLWMKNIKDFIRSIDVKSL